MKIHTRLTVAGLATLAVLPVSIGLTGQADATPNPLSSKHDKLTTDDGWKIRLDASELVVNPMHNLANAPTSREGWI